MAPAPGGTYVEAVVGAPRYINPLLAAPGSADDDICALVYNGLTRVDPSGDVRPDLALDWGVSADGREYTFRLRSGARWHDGRPLIANDVLATYKLLQAADFAGDAGLAGLWRGITVVASDDVVTFRLPSPNSWFLEQASLGILPAHLLGSTAGHALLTHELSSRPIGTGPFKATASDQRGITLAAHDGYHGPPSYIRGVELRFFANADEALSALRRRDVMAIRPHRAADLPAAIEGFTAYTRAERAKATVLVFNTRAAPFDDVGLRRAAAEALGGREAPAMRGVRAAIVTNDDPDHVRIAEDAARRLNAAGAGMEVHSVGWTGMVADILYGGRFQAAVVEHVYNAAEPDLAPFFSARGPFNFGRWSSPPADELLARARAASTHRERSDLLREWRGAFDAATPAVVIEQSRLAYFASTALQGLDLGPLTAPKDRFANIESWYLHTRRVSPLV